jgi:hypothetical protein
MIKLVDLLKEIGEASKAFNTTKIDDGKTIFFKIDDPNFPFDNFWIAVTLGDKDNIIAQTPDDNSNKSGFDLSKYRGNAAKIDFGIIENDTWTFPEINKGYLFGVMGTVVNSIKSVLAKHKEIEYLLFIPAVKMKSTNRVTPNKNFKPTNNPPVNQDTQISDNGSQRQNLYLAYVRKQLPNAGLDVENGWNVINLK